MTVFHYQARNLNGKRRQGTLEADSAVLARQQLREQQLFPENLSPVAQGSSGASRLRGLSRRDRLLFTRQLAGFIQSGLPLVDALQTLADHARSNRVREVLVSVRSQLSQGFSLSDSLAHHRRSFDRLYCAMVSAGEQSGQLGPVLENLADYLEQSHLRRRKIQTALIYPLILTIVSVLIIVALMIWVVPRITQQFDRAGQALPALTEAMISISHFLSSYGLWLVLAIAFVAVVFHRLMKQDRFRLAVHTWLLKLPVLGGWLTAVDCARLCRTLGLMLSCGVPLMDALRCTLPVIRNYRLFQDLEQAAGKVKSGSALGVALEESGRFPALVIYMISSGEAASELDDMLLRSAGQQEQEVESAIAVAMGLFEPVLILTMGGVVLTIVLAILLPILELNNLIRM